MLLQAAHDVETGEVAWPRPESREFPSTSTYIIYHVDLGTMIVNLSSF